MKRFLLLVLLLLPNLAGCGSGSAGDSLPVNGPGRALDFTQAGAIVAPDSQLVPLKPYTPNVDPEPEIAHGPAPRALTTDEQANEAHFSAELSDPNRPVFHHTNSLHQGPDNIVGAGNGEAVGLFTSSTFAANGSVVNFGVQKNYVVSGGGNFFHTHQFVNNQCFEYGINYAAEAPTLFGYNWCTGGNTPQGFINRGLVGDPGGVLNTWDSTGNGWLFKWDSANSIFEIALEEVKKSDGWHLLGYNWSTTKFIDLMDGHGVTGTKGACCGWSVFEVHVSPGASCAFDAAFEKGHELLYDTKMQAMIGTTWTPLDKISNGGFSYNTKIDCANISGKADASYVSPYFSGGFVAPSATAHSGDWWMIQR